MDIESILAGKGRDVRTIRPDSTVAEAMRRMRDEAISALVVSDDGRRIAGIVSDRGILRAIVDHGADVMRARVLDIMTTEVFTCSPAENVNAIMSAMTERRIRHIPVVDDRGLLCGLISIGDVVKQRLDEMQNETEAMREYISGAG
jgi:CBS domain-containing protein